MNKMNFGDAIKALKEGRKAARSQEKDGTAKICISG